MIHYAFPKGKKILVILKSGKNIVGKYKETKSGMLILDNVKIAYEDIRSATIKR